MLRRLCTTAGIRRPSAAVVAAAFHPHSLLPYRKPYSHSCADSDEKSSLTVSFLSSSAGLSAEAARSIAQRVQSNNIEKVIAVLALLKDYGFSEAHITSLVTRSPRVLTCDPEKILKPKLEFYQEIGLDGAALPKILAASPWPLLRSLKKLLVPNVNFLKSILGTNKGVVAAIKHSPALIIEDFGKNVLPRIEALRANGASDTVIVTLLKTYGNAFNRNSPRFAEAFEAIMELGVPPSTAMFAHALGVFVQLPVKRWEEKVDNLRCLGWSQDQILLAFARHPYIARTSAQKIKKNMKFLEEKLGWGPEYLSMYPVLLSLSMEKRLMPRFAVLHILKSKGLLKANLAANQFIMVNERFLRKFVTPHQEGTPDIVGFIKGSKAK
ncbi:hypothetical protein Cni_G07830 [Canna indica]|uniref:Uncharacterized protein n=1 Tax=Canna indica TaxID=4628 RepID=A0AAQ3K103_9LILI|nr:hypothetical protein Cni_G07830 [Canna indica]